MDFSRPYEPNDSGDSEVENASLGRRMPKCQTIMSPDSPSKAPFRQINESVSGQTNFQHQQFTYLLIDDYHNPCPPPVTKFDYEQSMMAPGMKCQDSHHDGFPPSQNHNDPFYMFNFMERPESSGLITPPPPTPKQDYDSPMMGLRRVEYFPPFQITPMLHQEDNNSVSSSSLESVYFGTVSPASQNELPTSLFGNYQFY
nr:hypothetical transcript [Hymenolepis microstoma]